MLKISSTLHRNNSQNNPQDTIAVKKSLNSLGYYEKPEYGITPYPDEYMFKAIKNFQYEQSLKMDGVIRPKGETLSSINDALNGDIPTKSPTCWCPKCGAPHGGSCGDLCPDCHIKQ